MSGFFTVSNGQTHSCAPPPKGVCFTPLHHPPKPLFFLSNLLLSVLMLRYSISTSSTASTTSNSRSRLAAAALLLSMSTTKLLAAVAPSASPASPAASPLKQQQQQMCTRYEVDTKAWIYNDRKIHTPVTFPCESGSGGGTSSSLKSSPMTEHLISSSLGASQGSTASISSPFVINFQCGASNKTLCGYAQDSFKSAAARLASVLVINTPIYVLANFSSFCGGTTQVSNCQLAETLGQASPAAFFSASPQDTSNSWFYYPQALVKQLNKNVTLQYSTYDIVAEFNSDFNFWFKTSGQPIQSSQTDFEFVIAHELTHGLGFVTGYEQWSSLFTGLTSQSNYIAPAFSYNGNTVADAIVANWDPVNIFDRFIVDGQSNSISKYAKGIYQYGMYKRGGSIVD